MEIVYWIALALHVVCWLGALVLIDPRGGEIKKGAAHAVAGALVLGLVLVGVGEAADLHVVEVAQIGGLADLRDFNHVKIGIKLLLAIIATVVAFMGQKRSTPNPLAGPLFGLVAANILIAVLW